MEQPVMACECVVESFVCFDLGGVACKPQSYVTQLIVNPSNIIAELLQRLAIAGRLTSAVPKASSPHSLWNECDEEGSGKLTQQRMHTFLSGLATMIEKHGCVPFAHRRGLLLPKRIEVGPLLTGFVWVWLSVRV